MLAEVVIYGITIVVYTFVGIAAGQLTPQQIADGYVQCGLGFLLEGIDALPAQFLFKEFGGAALK